MCSTSHSEVFRRCNPIRCPELLPAWMLPQWPSPLAWLPQRSPNILLIPGTSSVEHLRENVAGAGLQLPDDAIEELDGMPLKAFQH